MHLTNNTDLNQTEGHREASENVLINEDILPRRTAWPPAINVTNAPQDRFRTK